MNRIEQVTVPAPAQQPQPRLPRALAGVRRRAAEAMAQPPGAPSRVRRGTSRFAVALATLAVPLLPGQALGAAPSHGAGAARPEAPHTWHHLRHPGPSQVYPGSSTMTFQMWAAGGWTLTIPSRADGMGMPGDLPNPRPDGYYRPWFVEPAFPAVLPDGERAPEAYRESHTSPRIAGPTALRQARSRVLPDPLIPNQGPANTKQMVVGTQQAAADAPTFPCLREPYPATADRGMLARLRPVRDAMNVVVTHERMPCAARVDYLSQARA
jgi:hypothetical protein